MDITNEALAVDSAQVLLANIGRLQLELEYTETCIAQTNERLKNTPEWDELRALKEDRKQLQTELAAKMQQTIRYAQPRLM